MTRKRANDEAPAEVTARRPFRGRRGSPRRAEPVRNAAIRRLRIVAAGPAAIATVLVALTAAFGGAPASAATPHAGPMAAHVAPARPATDRRAARRSDAMVTGVTWHALSLLGTWQSEQGSYDSGNPSWAVNGGVVYLSGSLDQPTGSGSLFAVLPPAARPAHEQQLVVYAMNGATAILVIDPDGQMFAYNVSSSSHDAQAYTSLAGVSFPAAATPRHRLTMLHGWQRFQSTDDFGSPAYTVTGGVVHLSGAMAQSVGTSDVFAVLPSGARPARVLYLTVSTANLTGVLRIYPNGVMEAYLGLAPEFTSLAGVSFPAAATPVHKLSLLNSWASMQSAYNTGDPAYTVTGGVVYLSGSIGQTAGSSPVFAVLPPAARPRHYLWIKTYTYDGAVGALVIKPSGVMEAFNQTGYAAQEYTSLAGISYPLGS